MSEIEKSFTFLHENIAQWLANVAEVEAKVVSMQEELARVPVSRSLPLKRKTGSMESIRDLNAIMEDPDTPAPAQSTPLMTRKRKTASVLSGNASGPSKFRSRMMIVVSYDGDIQKSFELLVRAIGTGRNLLRKGKMAAKLDAMAALAASDDDDDDDDNDDTSTSKIGYRHRTGLTSMRTRAAMMQGVTNNPSSGTPTELFDSTDKELEAAQSLCEKAAHQSLREGDCRKELEAVRNHFEAVQEVAKREVARYTARKEKEEQELATASLEPKTEIQTVTSTSITPTPIPSEPKRISPIQAPPPSGVPQVIDIEVDEEEEEDMEFVMPPIRFTSRI